MKSCPKCKKTFNNDSLANCPDDGTALLGVDKALPKAAENPASSNDSATVDVDALSRELELKAPIEDPPSAASEVATEKLIPATKFTTGASDSPPPSIEEALTQPEKISTNSSSAQKPAKSHKKALVISLSILGLALITVIGVLVGKGSIGTAKQPTVHFSSTPTGASVVIDGKVVGQSPLSIPVAPGKHKVEFREGGFDSVVEIITVNADGTVFSRELTPSSPSTKTNPSVAPSQ